MKASIFVVGLFLSINIIAQQSHQGVRLFIYELSKTGKQLISNGKIEVTINDSTQSLTTDDYGKINLIETPAGECTIKVKRQDCDAYEMKGIEVMKNKIAYLSFELVCQSYINSLSKKERKALGLLQ